MITLEKLKQLEEHFNDLYSVRKKYEDEQIKILLRFFNIPEHKSENIMSIEELLEYDSIYVRVPSPLFEEVDFKQFNFPNKIRFILIIFDESIIIFGYNNLMNKKIILQNLD